MSTNPALLKHATSISAGSSILYSEDVFVMGQSKKMMFLGKRKNIVTVISEGIKGCALCEIVKSVGVNAFAGGTKIQKPLVNLSRGLLIDLSILHGEKNQDKYEGGGHLEGYENGKKVALTDSSRGGIGVGAKHTEGGIKALVGEEKRPIEFEDEEPVLVSKVQTSTRKYNFEGRQLPGKEVASILNQRAGGVAFADGGETPGTVGNELSMSGGEIILTHKVATEKNTTEFEGKQMTPRQIASKINVDNGGVAFADGGTIPITIRCSGKEYSYGGQTMKDSDITKKMCGCQH